MMTNNANTVNVYATEASAANLRSLILEMTYARSIKNDRYLNARKQAVEVASLLAYQWGYTAEYNLTAIYAGSNAVKKLWTRTMRDRSYIDSLLTTDGPGMILSAFKDESHYERALRKAYMKDIETSENKKEVLTAIKNAISNLEMTKDPEERSFLCKTVEQNIHDYYTMFLKSVIKELFPEVEEESFNKIARNTYLRFMKDKKTEGFLESITPKLMLDTLREDASIKARIHATLIGMHHVKHLSTKDLNARIRQMALESNIVRHIA